MVDSCLDVVSTEDETARRSSHCPLSISPISRVRRSYLSSSFLISATTPSLYRVYKRWTRRGIRCVCLAASSTVGMVGLSCLLFLSSCWSRLLRASSLSSCKHKCFRASSFRRVLSYVGSLRMSGMLFSCSEIWPKRVAVRPSLRKACKSRSDSSGVC